MIQEFDIVWKSNCDLFPLLPSLNISFAIPRFNFFFQIIIQQKKICSYLKGLKSWIKLFFSDNLANHWNLMTWQHQNVTIMHLWKELNIRMWQYVKRIVEYLDSVFDGKRPFQDYRKGLEDRCVEDYHGKCDLHHASSSTKSKEDCQKGALANNILKERKM